MRYKLKLFTPIVATLMVLAVVLAGITFFYDRMLFYISGSMVAAVFLVVIIMLCGLGRRVRRLLEEVAAGVRYGMGGAFTELPTPVLTLSGGHDIVWYNGLCAEKVFGGRQMLGEDIGEVFPGIDFSASSPPEGYNVEYGGRMYTAFAVAMEMEQAITTVVYMMDDTRLKFFAGEYHQSKPGIALITVDNYEELIQDYKDSERAKLMSEIEQTVDGYITGNHGFVARIARDRFIAVIEARGISNMLAGKIELLDKVRGLSGAGRMPATLSIGISAEAENLHAAEQGARQALDMCLGRGGDQAAVKTANGYDFYGGISKAVEKRTKVKTRIIATALAELVDGASNVILMGHRFADLDCVGAAAGMLRAIRGMNKQVRIVLDREKNLVGPMLEKLLQSGYTEEDFVSPDAAVELAGPQSLLIILDTHLPAMLESEALYRAVKNVVVIDHHRKLVGHIDNAVIFHHEPYASSACEMVSELLQYFPGNPVPSRAEAEALMSGIMLDTKNFVLRTGVRTFEAAAWLRKLGADTVDVRRMFASSMESYRQKAAFITSAQIYRGCAIASSDEDFEGIRIIAPQAADELTAIADVDASFVLFVFEGAVNVSARSLGAINVQRIMEALGGGGHMTMAAAQFPGADIESVSTRLKEAIDGYYSELRQPAANN